MTKPRGNEPYKLRNSRYKLLVTILYHRALKRPTANTVETGPSELTRLAGLSKNHITVDNLKWLEDMNYITEVECRYGSVKFKINTHLIVAQEPKPAAPSVGSPSESALAGGVVISQPSEEEQMKESEVDGVSEWGRPEVLKDERKELTQKRLGCDCKHNVILYNINYKHHYDFYQCGLCRKELKLQHSDLSHEYIEKWKEELSWKQEKEAEGPKTASEKSSAASISQPKLKLKLKPPFTIE